MSFARRVTKISIVVSGRRHAFIARQFADRPNVTIEEIHGLTLDYDNNELDLSDSVLQNLKSALPGLAGISRCTGRSPSATFSPKCDQRLRVVGLSVRHAAPTVACKSRLSCRIGAPPRVRLLSCV